MGINIVEFNDLQGERVCPGCGTQWHGSSVKAEAVEEENDGVEEEENDADVNNTQPPEPSMKRRRRATKAEIAESESSLSSTAIHDSRRASRRSARIGAN